MITRLLKPHRVYETQRFFSSFSKPPLKQLAPPSVVAFDLNDTLWNCEPYFKLLINQTRAYMKQPYWKGAEFNQFIDMPIDKLFDTLFDPSRSERAKGYFDGLFEQTKPEQKLLMPYAVDLFRALKSHDIKILAVSNLDESMARKLLKDFGLLAYLDALHAAPGLKPQAVALLRPLEQVRISPGKHVWMVGNSLRDDVQCAAAAGCSSILFKQDGYSQERHYCQIEPTATVSNHQQLTELLRSLLAKNINEKPLCHKMN